MSRRRSWGMPKAAAAPPPSSVSYRPAHQQHSCRWAPLDGIDERIGRRPAHLRNAHGYVVSDNVYAGVCRGGEKSSIVLKAHESPPPQPLLLSSSDIACWRLTLTRVLVIVLADGLGGWARRCPAARALVREWAEHDRR